MADKKIHTVIKEHNTDFSPKFFETESGMGRFQKAVHVGTSVLEMILTIILFCAIIVSFLRIPSFFENIYKGEDGGLTQLVSYVALIIIVIELIQLLNLQNLRSVIEILMLAFVRELIIKDWSMLQLVLGVGAVAGLFAINKYLINKKKEEE